jgi:hypothetical protein
VTIAGVTVKDTPAEFSEDPTAGASVTSAGSLGSDFLSRFTLTFDYPHNRVYVKKPAASSPSAPNPPARQ